jgi:WS/DGAT/MGAT family acyltransferase
MGRGGDYLSQNDTIMWAVEADPLLRSTIAGVAVLDHAPAFSEVRRRVEAVTWAIPHLRCHVAAVPLHPTTLRWVEDPQLDLDYHVRHLTLPAGATLQDALDLVRTQVMSGFDRARPLWEFLLVDGLDEGRAVWAMKAHHVLTDGIGSVQLAAQLFDFSPEPPPPPKAPDRHVPPDRAAGTADLLVDVVLHDIDGMVDLARRTLGSVIPGMLHAVREPHHVIRDTVNVARSIGRAIAPATETLSPLMRERRLSSAYRTLDVSTELLHAAAHRHNATLNDAFLAGITGGMSRYHAHHGHEVDELRVAMPLSLRTEDHEAGGNHVTVMRFTVPVGNASVAERLQRLHERVKEVRAEPAIAYTEVIAGVLSVVPVGVLGAMLRHVDFLASNVPGTPTPMYLAGAEVTRFYPFGPTAGSAVNITVMSYAGTFCIGVNADGAAIPDPDRFVACLAQGFAEVLAA